jgi:FkbM family methyltransferase
MNIILEKLSWVPYRIVNFISKKSKKKEIIDLNKIDIPEKIPFNYIPEDDGLSNQFSTFGFREPLNWKNYYNFVDEKDIVLDIGANIGLFSILSKDAKEIICVEPIKECIPVLKKNLEDNNLEEKSEVLNMAVGKKGSLYLKKENHVNLSKVVDKKEGNVQEVRSEPIDYFVKKYNANVLRMDVEGYGYEILKGKIPEKINKISMEFHAGLKGKEKSRKLLKHFEEEGFVVEKIIEDLPLRLYPFFGLLKKTGLLKKFTYKKRNLKPTECIPLVLSGRTIKYLFLRR